MDGSGVQKPKVAGGESDVVRMNWPRGATERPPQVPNVILVISAGLGK